MPDIIQYTCDLPVPMKELYDWLEDPTTGAIVAPAKEVVEVNRSKNGRVESFKTKHGLAQMTVQDYPKRWVAEYRWPGNRVEFDVRLQSFGEPWTRVSIDCNLQPQSFRGRLLGTKTWEQLKGHLNHRLEALQEQFKATSKKS
jgi:hypothetical protein